jgi:hypothetical protein
MKTIVSTKGLSRVIKDAIINHCTMMSVSFYDKQIRFTCPSRDFFIECAVRQERTTIDNYTFNPIKMYKLMEFLDLLPEQPILVEFKQITDDECDIKLTDFVANF